MIVLAIYIHSSTKLNPCYRMHYKGYMHYTWLSDKGCLPIPISNKRRTDALGNLNRITKE